MGPLGRKQSSREPPPPTEAFAGAEHPVPPPGMQVGTCSQLRGAEATLPSSERLHGAPNPQTFPAPPAQIGGISPNPNSSRGRGPQIQMHPVGWGVGGSQSPEHPKLRAMGTRVSPPLRPTAPSPPSAGAARRPCASCGSCTGPCCSCGVCSPSARGDLGVLPEGGEGGKRAAISVGFGGAFPSFGVGARKTPWDAPSCRDTSRGWERPCKSWQSRAWEGGGGGWRTPGHGEPPPPPPLPCLGRATYLLRGLSRLCARCAAAGFYTGEV